MKKDELVKENARLATLIAGFNEKDEAIRTNLSKFLDSSRISRNMYRDEIEIVVLSWPEIYFEIGKLKETNSNYQQVEEVDRRVMLMTKQLDLLMRNKNEDERKEPGYDS